MSFNSLISVDLNWKPKGKKVSNPFEYTIYLTKNGMRISKKLRKNGSAKRTRISFKVFNKRLNSRKKEKLHVNAVNNAEVVFHKFRPKDRKNVYRKPLCYIIQNEIVEEMHGLSLKRKFDDVDRCDDELPLNIKRMKLNNKLRKKDVFTNVFEFPMDHRKKFKLM